ncbi:hypothetical protein SUGI_0104760 [Cryptomeria japonica]|nr:hypothetical protein SUGI_0104760 [Cryptomeria japonica]
MKRALENGKDDGEAKRICAEDKNSEVDEFFALLKRIDETEKQLRRANNRQQLPRKEASAWRPSFEWEDFCTAGNRTRDVQQVSLCIPRHDNNTQIARESLDLNLPPASSRKEQ